MVFRTLLLYYTKSAHVKQAFSHRLRRIFQNRKCAFSVRKFPKIGKRWKRVRYLPFFKKSVHSGGQKLFKTHLFGRFRKRKIQKSVNLVMRKSEKTKTFICFLGYLIILQQIQLGTEAKSDPRPIRLRDESPQKACLTQLFVQQKRPFQVLAT